MVADRRRRPLGHGARGAGRSRQRRSRQHGERLGDRDQAWLGKLEAPDDLPDHIEAQGFGWLAVGAEHAWRVRDLPLHHRDPFDRLLVAQALSERVAIVSADGHFGAYGVETRW